MKYRFLIGFLLFLIISTFTNTSFGFEGVTLIPTERKTLGVPRSKGEMLEEINRENLARQKKEEKSSYFEAEEEVFESKAGKALSKFINEKAINNKLNCIYADVESRFLDEDY